MKDIKHQIEKIVSTRSTKEDIAGLSAIDLEMKIVLEELESFF